MLADLCHARFMRLVVLAALAVAGCASDPEGVVQQTDLCEMPDTTWCAPVGAACIASSTPFCDHGNSWCDDGTCRDFCSAVDWPRCPAGEVVHDVTLADGSGVCTCRPD